VPKLLAGIWTQFLRPMLRIQSFGLLTRQRRGGREAVLLEEEQAKRWLNPNSSRKELRAIAEGWWEQDLFSPSLTTIVHNVVPRLELQPVPMPVESKVEIMPEVKLEVEGKAKFSPGDQVRNPSKKIGEVLEVQSHQKHEVLVRYPDGLELWHSSRELHRSRI
jgi:hypothetical protein